MDELGWNPQFLTNMRRKMRPALEKTMERFPNTVRIEESATDLYGGKLPDYFAVLWTEGRQDLSEFWKYFDKVRMEMGLYYLNKERG